MKPFDEFVSQLSDDEYEAIRKKVMENRQPCSATDAIPEISFKMALELLRKYHEWLEQ